jgi:hypothetical protein
LKRVDLSMRQVDEFMLEFFRARIAEERRHQASRLPFRNKFFADDCWYDSRADTLRRIESEKIISIEKRKPGCIVITEQALCNSRGVKAMRFRYHLQAAGDDWIIRDVFTGCVVCGARGDTSCPCCKGEQWINLAQKGGDS